MKINKKEVLAEIDPDILLADGFDDALIGVTYCFKGGDIAVYDRTKCLQILVKRDKMSWEEAEEFFEFNVQGAYVGEKTPKYVTLFKDLPA